MYGLMDLGKLRRCATVIALSAAMPAGTALAADALQEITPSERMLPAVSDVNAKIETAYTHFDLDEGDGKGYLLQGAASLPIGQRFGFQLDAGTLNADVDSGEMLANGIGGHLFWRDPSVGLLGIYGHHVDYGNEVEVNRLGVELEAYSGQFSFEGFAGVDRLDTSIGDDEFLAAEGTIAWYATENFRLSAGVQHSFDQTKGLVGMEMMLDGADFAPAIYANAASGGDETTLMAGLRLYLGKSKSLKARHREDDPAIGLFDQFGAVANCGVLGDTDTTVTQVAQPRNAFARLAPQQPRTTTLTTSYELDGCDVKKNVKSPSRVDF